MSTISSGTTLTTALVQTGDTTGDLVIKTGSSNTTAMTISGSDQSVTLVGSLTANTNASTITTGTVPTARLATGTANSSTYLRGDQTWAAIASSQWTTTGSDIYYNTGNVGIGTSSPSGKLEVSDGTGFVRVVPNISTGANAILSRSSSAYISMRYIANQHIFNGFGDSGANEAMRIDSSGNVGIGTSSPATKIDARLSGTSSGTVINVGNTGSGEFGGLGISDGGAYPVELWGSSLSFKTGSSVYASAAEKMRITSDGLLQFNSDYGSVATAYGCRAWVNFNGTGTVAIRASGNVSSVSDGGTGNYTINFTNAMPDANYSVTECIQADVTNSNRNLTIKGGTSITTSSFSVVVTGTASSTTYDVPVVNLAIFR